MRKNHLFRKMASVLLSLMLMVSLCVCTLPVQAAAQSTSYNYYNIVLVVDGSGSMTWTDSQDWRYEAILQFVGLLSEQGNCLGAVVFDHEVQVSMDLSDINGKSDKKTVTDAIENYEVDINGDTNIGLALDTAVEMIEQSGDKNLPSVIILLSDGNTDMDEDEALQTSLDLKADAIDRASDKGIPIHTVCLNEDGSANTAELKQIADATGGYFEEVSEAEDLKKVFNTFYKLIYNAISDENSDEETFPENGIIEKDFHVPAVCVRQANIMINGNVSDIEMTKPDGSMLSGSALDDLITASKSFTLIKIADPDAGDWHIKLLGNPGDTINVDFVYDGDFVIEFSLKQAEDIPVNTVKNFKTTIIDGGTPVTGKDDYSVFEATLIVKDAAGAVLDTVTMTPGDDAFSVDYTFDEIGTFYLSSSVVGEGYDPETAPVMVNVGNTAPYLAGEDTLTKKIYRLPFGQKPVEIDLTGMAKDAEDSTLTYQIMSTAFLEEDYQMDQNGTLTMVDYSLSKGSFTINAYDSMGAYCSFTVKITTVNVALWTVILILIIALIVAGVFGILLWIALQKPFRGTCYAQSMVDGSYSQWSEVRKARGRVKLTSFGIPLPQGISGTAYLQASSKNYVTLVSKTPFYCRGQKVKEMKVTSFDIEIRADQNSMDAMWIHFNGRTR